MKLSAVLLFATALPFEYDRSAPIDLRETAVQEGAGAKSLSKCPRTVRWAIFR